MRSKHHPSPNAAKPNYSALHGKTLTFMSHDNDYQRLFKSPPKRHSRYSWKDILGIAAVVVVVGGIVVGISTLFFETLGPECMFIHCVKVIR